MEPTLSVKLKVMPGITKDISITLTDLITAFNKAWTLEDRLQLLMGLDLEEREIGMHTVGTILNKLKIDEISDTQLMIVSDAVTRFKDKIEKEKEKRIAKSE